MNIVAYLDAPSTQRSQLLEKLTKTKHLRFFWVNATPASASYSLLLPSLSSTHANCPEASRVAVAVLCWLLINSRARICCEVMHINIAEAPNAV